VLNAGMKNIKEIEALNQDNPGILVRSLSVNGIAVCIAFIKEITDRDKLIKFIIEPIISCEKKTRLSANYLLKTVLCVDDITIDNDPEKITEYILKGFSVIALSNDRNYLVAGVKTFTKRSIDTPKFETIFRGPKDSFSESIEDNISLIRYRIPDPTLKIDIVEIGKRTRTKVGIAYMEDIVNKEFLKEVQDCLADVTIDGITQSSSIQALFRSSRYTLFPTVDNIEVSEKACANLLDGKIIILLDGGGIVLGIPQTFIEFLDCGEDFYDNIYFSAFVKILRLFSMVITPLASALYVAVVSFAPDILPSNYILTIAMTRATVPFNAFTEALLMEMVSEILREASLRIPRLIGPAISIVGTLVIGQAAVAAKLVSPLMIIIVALSLMCSFTVPNYTIVNPLRLVKFIMLLLTGMFGLFGFILGVLAIGTNLISTSSFGVPYMAPFAPFDLKGIKNFLFSEKINKEKRPKSLKTKDSTIR